MALLRRVRAAWLVLAAGALLALPIALKALRTNGVRYSSLYLPMRDGTRIAIDLYLPRRLRAGEKLPTILHQTRYYRSYRLRWPVSLFFGGTDAGIARFVRNRYAYVSADVRGSGASFGSRQQEWSPDEVKDGAELVDWIIRQPWSDGKVGATGVSYDGTAAEFLLSTRHPAVKAAALRFSLFDTYTDIAFPGGIHHTRFTEMWGRGNQAMDRNEFGTLLGGIEGWAFRGVRPVSEDRDGALLRAAIRGRASNYDVHENAMRLTYRDDPNPSGRTIDAMSPHLLAPSIAASGAAVLSVGGWYDGAYASAALRRFQALGGPQARLLIGPWNHAGNRNLSPFARSGEEFDHTAELLRFFDYHLRETVNGYGAEQRVRYYTVGEERWKAADSWPPPGVRPVRYYLGAGGKLLQSPGDAQEEATYRVDSTSGSGGRARWNSLLYVDQVDQLYPDWNAREQKFLRYTSPPLEQDTEITGEATVHLRLSSSERDGTFFLYLEDVDANGKAGYVTEGMLRAIHRKPAVGPTHTFKRADAMPLVPDEPAELSFTLLPISYLFRRGHSIRIGLSGADRDHFAGLPGAPLIRVYQGGPQGSFIELPVVRP